jgi:aminoglycoside phosphotransferase (APT) family kinase protein
MADVRTAEVKVAVASAIHEVDAMGHQQSPHLGGYVGREEDQWRGHARARASDEVADEGLAEVRCLFLDEEPPPASWRCQLKDAVCPRVFRMVFSPDSGLPEERQ